MRIGIITGEYPPMKGGVGAYTEILAHKLADLGHEVFILTSSRITAGIAEGVTVSTTIQTWDIGCISLIRDWIRDVQPDVIHLQYQTAAFQMSPVVHFLPDLLRPIPFVTTFHDLRYPYLFPKAGRLREWIVRRLARKSSGVIVTNHEDAAQLTRQIKTLPLMRLVPIGSNILAEAPIDTSQFRLLTGASADKKLIVYFGLINRSKGLEPLLQALRQLLDYGIAVRLALIGAVAGDSDLTNLAFMKEIEALIKALHLEGAIYKTGYLEDNEVAGYLAASDVVALPFADGASYRRGSLMAAIRLGCAILTTLPRVEIPTFQDRANMRLVAPGDATKLASALIELLENESLRKKLREGSQALASSFEWSKIAEETVEVFEKITGGRR